MASLPRHRRRRLHRLAPGGRAHARAATRVRVVDSLITGKRQQPRSPAGRRVPRRRSRRSATSPARAVAGMDYVLHQAAIPSVPRSVKDPVTSNRANIDASLNVLVAARDAGVKRLVYAGSSSAYGDTPTLPKREDMPTGPLSPYALQKLVAEQYCQMFTRLYGFETVTIRYFNVFGPRQDPGLAVLGRHLAVRDRAPRGASAGHLRRRRADARLHLRRQRRRRRAARVRGAGGGGRGDQRRDRRPHLAERAAEHDEPDRRDGHRARSTRNPRAGDVRDSQADISKAKRLLGYDPTVGLEDGLRRTLEWCRTPALSPSSP